MLRAASRAWNRGALTAFVSPSKPVRLHIIAAYNQAKNQRVPADSTPASTGSKRPLATSAPKRSTPKATAPRTRPAASTAATEPRGPKPTPLPTADVDTSSPTYVPRNEGIQDGDWSTADRRMVQRAQADAVEAVKPKKVDGQGMVLLGKTVEELRELATSMGQPEYRGKQLYDAVLQGARSLDVLTTVPKQWRQELTEAGVRTGRSIVHHSVEAPDGTRKFLLQLHDGRVVETVGIPADEANTPRLTVCVSSQVGCPMRCTFCATGKGGFARNLMVHEIIDQVLTVQEMYGRRVSNVVFMGMGEPLLNLPAVAGAFKFMNQDMGIGARNITISTVGVPNAITRLSKLFIKATLAVSIHAPNQALREQLVPSAKAYPLQALMEECASYFQTTGRRVTFEYTLLKGVNDSPALAEELANLLKQYDMASHVNLIPWNPVSESDYAKPSRKDVSRFKKVLEKRGLEASVRATRGLEAAAACGQLRNDFQKTPLESFAVPA